MNAVYPNLSFIPDKPPQNLQQSLTAQFPVSTVNVSSRPLTPFSSYLSSGLPSAQTPKSTWSQNGQPQRSSFTRQIPLKPTKIKPSPIVHKNLPTTSVIRRRPYVLAFLATPIGQSMPYFSLSDACERFR